MTTTTPPATPSLSRAERIRQAALASAAALPTPDGVGVPRGGFAPTRRPAVAPVVGPRAQPPLRGEAPAPQVNVPAAPRASKPLPRATGAHMSARGAAPRTPGHVEQDMPTGGATARPVGHLAPAALRLPGEAAPVAGTAPTHRESDAQPTVPGARAVIDGPTVSVPSKRRAPKADKVILSSPRRTVEFSIRLTPDERDAWHAAAQAAGSSSTAAYFRDIGNAHIEGRKIQEPDPNILALLHEWQQIGKNLNQIPLGINRANLIGSPVHLEQIAGHLAVIRGVIDNDRDTLAAAA